MRFLDLFSGAGGISVGFELTGAFTCAAGIDAYAPAVTSFYANHPHAQSALAKPLDITEVDAREYAAASGGKIDVVVGGPPCQGFSHAGPRDRDDARNRMVWEFMRFVENIRPSAFVMENVSGLLTTAQSKRGEILEILREEYFKLGYSTSWKIVNSVDYRVPQKRKRLILVGLHDKNRTFEFPVTPCGDDTRLFAHPERVQTVGDALGDLPSPLAIEPQPYEQEPQSWLQRFLRSDSTSLRNHSQTKHSPEMVERLKAQRVGTRLYENWNHSWHRLDPNSPSPAVKENHRAPFVHFSEPRCASPRECARLQTFPDWFALSGTKTHQLVQVGNAVPSLMAAHLATALADQLGLRVPSRWDAASNPWESSSSETRISRIA
jgi:DNA (cytosine-5)-methyltransferase 1